MFVKLLNRLNADCIPDQENKRFMIRLAKDTDLKTVLQITRDTISKIYPKYYAKGVVEFFLQHHKQDNILEDIQNGCVAIRS